MCDTFSIMDYGMGCFDWNFLDFAFVRLSGKISEERKEVAIMISSIC